MIIVGSAQKRRSCSRLLEFSRLRVITTKCHHKHISILRATASIWFFTPATSFKALVDSLMKLNTTRHLEMPFVLILKGYGRYASWLLRLMPLKLYHSKFERSSLNLKPLKLRSTPFLFSEIARWMVEKCGTDDKDVQFITPESGKTYYTR